MMLNLKINDRVFHADDLHDSNRGIVLWIPGKYCSEIFECHVQFHNDDFVRICNSEDLRLIPNPKLEF